MDTPVQEAAATLFAEIAERGARWVKGLGTNDWRRNLVSELRGSDFGLMGAQQISALKRQLLSNIADRREFHGLPMFVVQPHGPADAERWAPAFGIEARKNKDKNIQLGFHVIFFGKPQGKIQSFGHRFDSPEGAGTTHNFFHAQPLKRWKQGGVVPGAFQVQPDTFPTFPLAARDSLDLALHALHVAGGHKLIRELCNTKIDTTLRQRANEIFKQIS